MNTAPPDQATIANGLSATFPELGDVSVAQTLGIGFNSVAVETKDGLVFRIARTEGTAARFAIERRLLPVLSERLPVDVPKPRWFSPASEHFPLGVMGYEKIGGRPLKPDLVTDVNRDRLVAQIADVLIALHGSPLAEVANVGLPQPEEMAANYRSLADETLPVLRDRMTRAEFDRIDSWWEAFLTDERMTQFEPTLTHGDFWFENMIVGQDASHLTGVVDWEHAAIGDRAQDFATLLHLGEEFTTAVIESYRGVGGRFGEDSHYRMRRLWELREFYGVLYGIRFEDDKELLDSIRKLREGPLLTT